MNDAKIGVVALGILLMSGIPVGASWAEAGFGAELDLDVKGFLMEASEAAAPAIPPVKALADNENIKRSWLRSLEKSKTSKDHHQYIVKNKIEIRFVQQIENSLRGSFYAVFENNRILISQQLVDESMAELSRQGYRGAQAEETFALKTLDLIVHELTHGRTEERIQDELHLKLTLPLLEDELLAYSAQMRALSEFQDPFTFGDVRLSATYVMHKALFEASYGGCGGIRSYIDQWNPVLSILIDQKEMVARLNGYIKPIDASLNQIGNRIQALGQGAAPRDGMTREGELGRLEETKKRMTENKQNLEHNLSILSSPGNYEAIQRFYRARLGPICG